MGRTLRPMTRVQKLFGAELSARAVELWVNKARAKAPINAIGVTAFFIPRMITPFVIA